LPPENTPLPQEHLCVSLWAANIPYLGKIAVHHWFVISYAQTEIRWEVWQSTNAGPECWGHLHRNLMPPRFWPHKDTPVLHREWSGQDAQRIAARIQASPEQYPWCQQYRYWPGPNSNTYVQWILLNEYKLGWKAAGRGYCRFA